MLIPAIASLAVCAALLYGCGGGSADCERFSDADGDAYIICKAGDHQVVYPLDEHDQPIERADGKVAY